MQANAHRVQAFILHYLVSWNATEAARKAGYSHARAAATGCELLKNELVQKAIAAHQARDAAEADVDPADCLRELKALAFSRFNHYQVDEINGTVTTQPGVPDSAMAAVKKVIFESHTDDKGNVHRRTLVELHDKVTPLIAACKHVGLCTDDRLEKIAQRLIKEATAREFAKLGADGRKFLDAEVAA